MQILLAWLFCSWAAADSFKQAPGEIPVYQAPDYSSRVLFSTVKGEDVRLTSEARSGFLRVFVNRAGKWRAGYIGELELDQPSENFFADHTWGFGGGGEYTYLTQGGKSFETTDQVHYKTSSYTSHSAVPFFAVQVGTSSFWRLTFALKQTHFTGKANTDITGAPSQDVTLDHKFISLLLQKAWTPLDWKALYLGAGLGIDKATSVALTLGGVSLPTTTQDQPTYLGIQGFVGLRTQVFHSFSFFGEARLAAIPNQTPAIYTLEGTVGVLYWPQFK